MAYSLVIKRQAKKKLESLSRSERTRITEKITRLSYNPSDPTLDIKLLAGAVLYRLRVGNWRIIFERNDTIKIIIIEKIKSRGDIYK